MVMRTSDGSFLFLGRVDSQMKVHGFRIEVSEIIKVLENIPDIRQAYVTVRKETADATLIAYCIREEGSSFYIKPRSLMCNCNARICLIIHIPVLQPIILTFLN